MILARGPCCHYKSLGSSVAILFKGIFSVDVSKQKSFLKRLSFSKRMKEKKREKERLMRDSVESLSILPFRILHEAWTRNESTCHALTKKT